MNLKPAQARILTAMHMMQEAAEMLRQKNAAGQRVLKVKDHSSLTETRACLHEAQNNIDRAYLTLSVLIDELPNTQTQTNERRAAA